MKWCTGEASLEHGMSGMPHDLLNFKFEPAGVVNLGARATCNCKTASCFCL